MSGWAIIIEFEVHEGRAGEFAALMREHARRTLDEEPGCLRFEVLQPIERDGRASPNRFLVSELYAGEAAAAHHEGNPRMPALRSAMEPLVKSRRSILARVLDGQQMDEGLRPEDLNSSNDG